MNKLLSLFIFLCGLCLLAGCGGSNPIPPPPLGITALVLPGGAVGTAYGGSSGIPFTASGGIAPYQWSWSAQPQSSLPPGLSFTPGGVLSGIPTAGGSYLISVKVNDSESPAMQASANYAISIGPKGPLALGFSALPGGTVGTAYGSEHFSDNDNFTAFILSATGGSGNYISWGWVAAPRSSLPPGLLLKVLSLTSGGSTRCCATENIPVIEGTPTTAGTYSVTVSVTDSETPPALASGTFQIVISAAAAAASSMAAPLSREHHTRYKLIDVGTLGGPNSGTVQPFFDGVVAPSLDQKETFAGQADTSTPDPFVPNCFNSDCYVSHAIKSVDGVRTDLGALPGPAGLSSATTWISGSGLIAGVSENGEVDPFTGIQSVHGVVWENGKISDLGTLKGGYESVANAINNAGEVAGYANNALPDANSLAGLGSQTRAVVWWNGEIHDLGTLGGSDAMALYVNDLGQIAGQSYTSTSSPASTAIPHCEDSLVALHAFLWENGRMTDLQTLGGTCALAYALNNHGQVVGQANLTGDSESHPFLWESGAMKDLGALGGTYGYAGWLNDSGQVVGAATNKGDAALLAFSWKGGEMTNLATLNGDACSAADAVNSTGQVVGGSGIYAAPFFPACTDALEHAVLWENGQILDLNSLVSSTSGLTLNEATFINDLGEISGFATLASGDIHAFVMIPCDANHPDMEGCDYQPMEVVSGVQVPPAQASAAASTSPAELPTAEIMTRFRSARPGRNRYYGTTHTSPH
jgi:probable HAF family extracellular repeat protein